MAVLSEREAASHWSVCLWKRLIVVVKPRISSSICFWWRNDSWTPPLTASTSSSDTRIPALVASFFAFSIVQIQIQIIRSKLKILSIRLKLGGTKRRERPVWWRRKEEEVWCWWSMLSKEASSPVALPSIAVAGSDVNGGCRAGIDIGKPWVVLLRREGNSLMRRNFLF